MWQYLKLLVIFLTDLSTPNNEKQKILIFLPPKEQEVITFSEIAELYKLDQKNCIHYKLRVYAINGVSVGKNYVGKTGAYTQLLNGESNQYPITHETVGYVSLDKENLLLGNTGTKPITIELALKVLEEKTSISVKQTA